jgi:hypothetical protein
MLLSRHRSLRWLMSEIEHLSRLEDIEREDALRDLFRYVDELDELTLARFKGMMAKLGVRGVHLTNW